MSAKKRYAPLRRGSSERRSVRAAESSSPPSSSWWSRAWAGIPIEEIGWGRWTVALLATAALFFSLYGTSLASLVAVWENEPDYSHGYLVVPFALVICWYRRDLFPTGSRAPGWGGLLLLLGSVGIAFAGTRFFLVPLISWAMIIWLCGVCWLLLGRRVFWWALPALLFLFFMVPLPFRVEQLMSWRLQVIATQISTWMLQVLGMPAVAETNIVYLGDQTLEVEQACSGLRMFMGISAVAYMFVVLARRAWWERVCVVLSVAPIAIFANSIRVAVTGILLQVVSSDAAKTFSHDVAGWAMVLVATLLFGLFLTFLRVLVVEVELDAATNVLGRSSSRHATPLEDGGGG